MSIDKAIEELENYNSRTFEDNFVTFTKALQLGIEALKREKQWRENPRWGLPLLLPGETE